MKIDGTYRCGFVDISVKVGALKVEDGKPFVEMSYSTKIIRWRRLVWKLSVLFCNVLDIPLPEPQMKEINP